MKQVSLLGGVTLILAQFCLVHGALAAPPDPPPPPACKSCTGPPSPPTPLPTPQTTLVPSQNVVNVHLAPTHVARGHAAKISVTARQDAVVTVGVRYKGAKKFVVSHGNVGSNGTLTKIWKVSRDAPLGTAQVRVDIEGEDQPFTATLVVVK